MPANSSVLSGQRADRQRRACAGTNRTESGESCMHMLGAEGVRPTARALLPSAALPSARVAQGGAGVLYEAFGVGSLQMKPSASTLTFCSQSRPSAGSVHAYHVLLPRVCGAGRRERYAPCCPAPRGANAQGCEWAYTRRPHSRETSYQAPGVGAEGRRSAPLVPLYSEHFAAILFERLRRVSPFHACEALPLLLSNSRPPPPESERTTSSEDLCRERDGGGRPSP